MLLNDKNLFLSIFTHLHNPAFEISAAAFKIFRDVLTSEHFKTESDDKAKKQVESKHQKLVSKFLDKNFDQVFSSDLSCCYFCDLCGSVFRGI